jgi:hypothetical protein
MMYLDKLIEDLEKLGQRLLELPATFIAYYDDLYGYPKSRQVLFIQVVAALGVVVGILEISKINFHAL